MSTAASQLDPNMPKPVNMRQRMALKITEFMSVPAYGPPPDMVPPAARRLINLCGWVRARNLIYAYRMAQIIASER